MNNITPASTKEEIIDSSLELIDTQAAQLANLKQQQTALLTVMALMVICHVIFWVTVTGPDV